MRLSMEEVRKQHDGIKKLYEQGLRGATASVEQVLDLFDTIEALQQENNGWQERYDELDAGHSRLFKDFCKLQQENKQLKTQLDEWKYEVKCHIDEVIAREKQIEQLQAQAARMWEALRKAKEAIKGYSTCPYCWGVNGHAKGCKFYEALQNIDALIGGKEDVKRI